MESTQSFTAADIINDDGQLLLPITCRFVPCDQWLVSHVDTSWKIKEVKHWLLRKCRAWGTSQPEPPRFRPASPVTFAPSIHSSIKSLSDEGVDTEEDDWDALSLSFDYHTQLRTIDHPIPERPTISSTADTRALSVDQVATKFTLFSYSNGYLLEDDTSLAWYNLRPYELLELHRRGTIVALPRARKSVAYAEPYFDSPVLLLNATVPEADGVRRMRRSRQPKKDEECDAEWKARWIVIREGVLSFCKDLMSAPTHTVPLSALCALRGVDKLGAATASTHPRAICAKFDIPATSFPVPDAVYAPDQRRSAGSMWIVFDMPDDSSRDNILRVLHRLAPRTAESSFIPALSLSSTPASEPTDGGVAELAAPYPAWRIAATERARKAGLGDLGPAMAHFLYGADEDAPLARDLRRKESVLAGLGMHVHSASMLDAGDGDGDGDGEYEGEDGGEGADGAAWLEDEEDAEDDGDAESEVEWEGWVQDVIRTAHRQPPPPPLPRPHDASRPASPARASPLDDAGDTAAPRARTFSFDPERARHGASTQSSPTTRVRSSTISTPPASSRRKSADLSVSMSPLAFLEHRNGANGDAARLRLDRSLSPPVPGAGGASIKRIVRGVSIRTALGTDRFDGR